MGGSCKSGSDPLPLEIVGCIACDTQLYFLPDSYPLVFHCGNGHCFTITDLLDDPHLLDRMSRGSTVKCWEGKAYLLHDLAGRALRNGNAFTAADFQEAAGRFDNWVAQLRALSSPPVPHQEIAP
jgi:hypothetical protein